jgi:hypothetical protein
LTASFLSALIGESKRIFLKGRCDKGKPVVRRGRKARGLYAKAAWLPNSGRASQSSPLVKEGGNAFIYSVMAIAALFSP